MPFSPRLIFAIGVSVLITDPIAAQSKLAKASSGQRLQQQMMTDVPHCARKLGIVSIADGDDPSRWTQWSLAPPSKLLKVLVARSGCFNLVARPHSVLHAHIPPLIDPYQPKGDVWQGQDQSDLSAALSATATIRKAWRTSSMPSQRKSGNCSGADSIRPVRVS